MIGCGRIKTIGMSTKINNAQESHFGNHSEKDQEALKYLYEVQNKQTRYNTFAYICVGVGCVSLFGCVFDIKTHLMFMRLFFSAGTFLTFFVSAIFLFGAGYMLGEVLRSAEKK